MTYLEAVELIIAIALLATSYYLTSKVAKKLNNGDIQPTTLSNRGDYAPLVIGTRRIGYLFALSYQRKSKNVSSGGKGSSGGSSGQNWRESAWHVLCPGPAKRIVSIFANGKRIWKTEINRDTSPSGTGFTLPNYGGVFYVYWGEVDQPVNPELAAHLGHNSCHPGMCHIVWKDFQMGTSPIWPQIEYIIECSCPSLMLNESSYEITSGSAKGVNLAHALLQILCARPFFGGGLNASEIDNDTLEAVGTLMETEVIGGNFEMGGGMATQQAVGNILADMGVMMPQVQGRLAFIPSRYSTDPVPMLTDYVILPPDFERTVNHGEGEVQRTIFTFKNEAAQLSYKDTDIMFKDDAEIGDIGKATNIQVPIFSATSKEMALPIARRRSQENAANAAFKLVAFHGFNRLVSGQRLGSTEFGNLRVVSVKPFDDKPEAELSIVPDIYAIAATSNSGNVTYGNPGGNLPAEDDLGITFFELPEALRTGTRTEIVVFRTRANYQMEGATVLVSVDSSAYTTLLHQDASASGGLLETAVADTDGTADTPSAGLTTIAVGPVFEDDNGDAGNDILDLTGDETSWASGTQIAVINGEIFFVESVTVMAELEWTASTAYAEGDYVVPTHSTGFRYRCTTAGTSGITQPPWPHVKGGTITDGTAVFEARYFAYQTNNLIRAQYDTVAGTHAIGDRIFIAQHSDLVPMSSILFSTGANVCVKTYPYNRDTVATTITPVCKDLA